MRAAIAATHEVVQNTDIPLALQALEKEGCMALFGSADSRAGAWDPKQVLQTIYSQNGGTIGGFVHVAYDAVPFDIIGDAATIGDPTRPFGLRVEINSKSWNDLGNLTTQNMGTLFQAAGLLHEMGHIYSATAALGSGGSKIKFDGIFLASRSDDNQALVLDKCFGVQMQR
jgi:hypothetical protein